MVELVILSVFLLMVSQVFSKNPLDRRLTAGSAHAVLYPGCPPASKYKVFWMSSESAYCIKSVASVRCLHRAEIASPVPPRVVFNNPS